MFMNKQKIPNEIIKGLFVGNYRNAEFIEENNITHILTVANDIDPEYPSDCRYLIVNIDDWHEEDLGKYFFECFQFIEEGLKSGGVLVHCMAGISRGPAIVIGYLMYKHLMTLNEAYELVKEKRPLIKPNKGFLEQLQELEKKLFYSRRNFETYQKGATYDKLLSLIKL